jgi:heat-inducible transcriptional repressor
MPSRRSARELSPRDREILKDIIQSFIVSGEPVSSRSVAKLERHGLSSASIRNIMADLEEEGYLAQPHTSAGRVPTRAAYHLYIEALMEARQPTASERRLIDASLREGRDANELVSTTGHLLSELSRQVGIVVTPMMGETRLKAIDFVPISDTRILCVVVSSAGFVDNKVIDIGEAFTREQLQQASNFLNDHFAGLTIREIRNRLLQLMAEERAQVDRLLAQALVLAQKGLGERGGGRDVVVDGTESLLDQPELASLDRVRRLFETFSDKARLVQMLNDLLDGQGVRVLIGEESALTSELDFSLVATTYGPREQPLGTLAVFGPSRMDYTRVVPLVEYLRDTLTHALVTCFSNERS